MKSQWITTIVCLQVLPVYRIAKQRLKRNTLIKRAIAVNKLAPALILWRWKSREVCSSSSAVRMNINEERRSDIAADGLCVVKPVVVIAILASDAIILNHEGLKVADVLVESH